MSFFWQKNENADTPLMEATWKGDIDTVQSLINGGADVNAKDKYGWTALMMAINRGHKIIARVLIKNGTDVKIRNKAGNTALFLAITEGDTETKDLLKQAGATE